MSMDAAPPHPQTDPPPEHAPEPYAEPPADPRAEQPRTGFTAEHPLAARRLGWLAAAALMAGTLGVGAAALVQGFYTPAGVVRGYLDDLARGDLLSALTVPGVDPTSAQLRALSLPAHPSRELLRSDELTPMRILSVRALGSDQQAPGTQRVAATVQMRGETWRTVYRLRQNGALAGILPDWSFAQTPLAVLTVDVPGGHLFTAGTHTLDTRAAGPLDKASSAESSDTVGASGSDAASKRSVFNTSGAYLVATPSVLLIGYRSALTVAKTNRVPVTDGAALIETSIDETATPLFTRIVQKKLDAVLTACTTQHVLEPTGCPFGATIDNRVLGSPTWKITSRPQIDLHVGGASWQSGVATGSAQLTAQVQSLLDGSISATPSDHPFTVQVTKISLRPHDTVQIQIGTG